MQKRKERKESFFDQMQQTKRARKPFDVLQRFWSKLNKLNQPFPVQGVSH